MKTPKGVVIENYPTEIEEGISETTTFLYKIKLDLTVERTNDPTFVTNDYQEWGLALFNNIKEKLEH
jgi:hypothetical protein